MFLPSSQFVVPIFVTIVVQFAPLLAQAPSANSELAADLQRGHAALQAKDETLATQEFRAALKLDPDNVDAHANLGVMAFFHGDCAAAEPEFQSTLRAA